MHNTAGLRKQIVRCMFYPVKLGNNAGVTAFLHCGYGDNLD
jgi:hypothetical protein